MIRVVQRRLIIPRGDTGTFVLPLLPGAEQGDVAVFSIFDPLKKEVILHKEIIVTSDELSFDFVRADTQHLEPSNRYEWDVRIYHEPVYDEDENLIDGATIDSYYAGFSLPACEIRETL